MDAPDWVDTPACARCAVRFTISTPKHHCRACLECVCTKCSPHHQPVPPRWTSPVRVCDRCYRGLVADHRVHAVYPHVFRTAQVMRGRRGEGQCGCALTARFGS